MKKTTLRRATALGLAGLTTMSTIAIVASADAFPTNVYELTYKGIASTARSASATAAMTGNTYVTTTDAASVFNPNNGFKVDALALFDITATYLPNYMNILNFSDGTWKYKEATAFTGAETIVIPEDYIVNRDGGADITDAAAEVFFFKTKAERDAAKTTIASKNQAEYTAKYNKAYNALKTDLTKIASAHKSEATKNLNALKTENSKNMDSDAYKTWLAGDYKTLSDQISSDYTARTKAITEVMKEFEEAYAPKNRGFGYTVTGVDHNDSDYAVFYVDDSATMVQITGIAGSTYLSAEYTPLAGGSAMDLADCKYRTQAAYVDEDSYAFKGEIVLADDLDSYDAHAAYLVSGDLWQQFSSSFEGGVTNNENTSEGGTKTDDTDDTTDTTPDQTSVYKVGGYYYPTYSAAYSAAAGNEDAISLIRDYTVVPYDYFSQVTGAFYKTYAEALKASGNSASRVTVFNGASTSTEDESTLDPYYYYWLNKQQSTTNKDTTSATLGKRTGWTSISNYLDNVSSGTSVTVSMNEETTVPSSVLNSIKGKNVTVKFVQDNGASITVNGKDIAASKNVDIDVTYNTKSISKKLIQNAFKKNGAVSSAQISIDEGSFGFESDLTVKFNSKRAGYSAKIYRYNSSRNSLQLVDTATVSNSGKTTFDNITKGGEFVIVLFED